jgi:hypothetical protein
VIESENRGPGAGGRFSRTAFEKKKIVGSAELHQNILWHGIVKLGFLACAS